MKRNKAHYFIKGVEKYIQGSLMANRTMNDVYGSWQQVQTARGYNALVPLHSQSAFYEYHDKIIKSVLKTETQYNCYTLTIVKDGLQYKLSAPYLLCQPSALMRILSEHGFEEIRK